MGSFFGRLLLFILGGALLLGGIFLIFSAIVSMPFVADYTDSFWLVGLLGVVAMLAGSFISRFAIHG
ncbi:hypothetical protein ABFB09_07605 [Dehalogenimonas sp. THU2]|uniref:hypothetical protein n=1 Tax=Dehalogenimonas sp. THU2 TaxID=3151121 RepID=UPI003218724E